MTQQPEDFDFVVGGAGPVGMTAAAPLSAGGTTGPVIERNSPPRVNLWGGQLAGDPGRLRNRAVAEFGA